MFSNNEVGRYIKLNNFKNQNLNKFINKEMNEGEHA